MSARSFFGKPLVQRSGLALIGAAAGFAYYAFVGCNGACALTGSPWSSAAFGGIVGALLLPTRKRDISRDSDVERHGS